MSTPILQKGNVDEFNCRVGRAMAAWSYIESSLCTYFQRLTGMHPLPARKVFYSVTGFDGRKRMLRAAVDSVDLKPPEAKEFLIASINKAGAWSSTRNLIVHGDTLNVDFAGSKYYKQTIIIDGKDSWRADLPDDDVITATALEMAAENFGRLAACLVAVLNWDNKNIETSPAKLIALVQALPKIAHTSRIDPNIASQHTLDGTEFRHWR